jgi:hypothetical protein
MKLWTLLAGLLVAGIVSGSVYAQDKKDDTPKKKRGGFMLKWEDFKLADENATLKYSVYSATALAKLPEGADKDKAGTRIKARWEALIKAAEVKVPDGKTAEDDSVVITGKKAYDDAAAKSRPTRGKRKKPADNA